MSNPLKDIQSDNLKFTYFKGIIKYIWMNKNQNLDTIIKGL